MAKAAAERKISTSVMLTTRQETWIREEARRLRIAEGDVHRRLLDMAIDSEQRRYGQVMGAAK